VRWWRRLAHRHQSSRRGGPSDHNNHDDARRCTPDHDAAPGAATYAPSDAEPERFDVRESIVSPRERSAGLQPGHGSLQGRHVELLAESIGHMLVAQRSGLLRVPWPALLGRERCLRRAEAVASKRS
jgi:hypothetical protein